jgi:hypothetical protein
MAGLAFTLGGLLGLLAVLCFSGGLCLFGVLGVGAFASALWRGLVCLGVLLSLFGLVVGCLGCVGWCTSISGIDLSDGFGGLCGCGSGLGILCVQWLYYYSVYYAAAAAAARPLVCEGGCWDTAIAALPHFLAHP